MRRAPPELRDFLSVYRPSVGRRFRAARRLVLEHAPEANELIYDAYNSVSAAYSFSDRLKEAFCHIAAYESHVNLGFNRGVELPDPHALLAGTGAKIRHLTIHSIGDLRRPEVHELLVAAVEQGRALVDSLPKAPASIVQRTSGKKRRPRRP
jgi:hypothetical protein